jgi:hypothetical protein
MNEQFTPNWRAKERDPQFQGRCYVRKAKNVAKMLQHKQHVKTETSFVRVTIYFRRSEESIALDGPEIGYGIESGIISRRLSVR